MKIVLTRHLNIEFRTREMYLIRLLIIYIDMMNFSNFNFAYQSFGSTNFKNIWETTCASVFNNNNTLTSMISKPNWNYTNQLKEYNLLEPKGSLLPDIVVINNKKGINTLWILDAKYYIFEIRGQKIFKQPGTSDITKQFFYNIAFLEYAQKNNLDIENVFLLPTELTTVSKWGYVSFEPILYLNSQLKTSKIKNIQVYLIPATIIFEKYLKNETMEFLF